MNATAKENHLLRQEIARLHREKDSHAETVAALARVAGGMGERLRECIDAAARKDKDIASLTHLLSIYSGADSPSGTDPRGYEATKRFLAEAKAHEEAKCGAAGEAGAEGGAGETAGESGAEGNAGDGESSVAVPAKPCGGRPGHPGTSHNAKPDRTISYTAKMCDTCGNTDLELMDPIKKPVANFVEGWGGKAWVGTKGMDKKDRDKKDVYTAAVTFGWCGTCRKMTDPAPHLVWGTWVGREVLATIIQYKSNPQGRSTIMDNLLTIHGFAMSPGAVSNAITAYARNLEGRVLPDSVAAFVKAKTNAGEDRAGSRDTHPEPAAEPEVPPSPAHPATYPKPTRRMTRKERKAEENKVPYGQTPQGATDAFLARDTTSYPGSHTLSFMEWCREWLAMAPYLGIDETKTVVAGKWCHAIVAVSPNVTMIVVRPRKNARAINWLFGGMLHVCVVHDRIAIYNGFAGMHQECWAHLIRRFRKIAMDCGVGSPEYDRYVVIRALYRRAQDLAARVAASLGVPSNAAEMAARRHRLEGIWHMFEPEYHSIMDGLLALVKDLDGREPGRYLEKMLRRSLTFVTRPGTPGTNNVSEGAIRWHAIRPRHVFGALPNWRAARNFGTIQTFAATCRKNGASPYHAVLARGRDHGWNVFASGAHPPIFPHMA